MSGIGIWKQIVAKSLENQNGAFDKWIVAGQEFIIPNELSLQGWQPDQEANDSESQDLEPLSPEKGANE